MKTAQLLVQTFSFDLESLKFLKLCCCKRSELSGVFNGIDFLYISESVVTLSM